MQRIPQWICRHELMLHVCRNNILYLAYDLNVRYFGNQFKGFMLAGVFASLQLVSYSLAGYRLNLINHSPPLTRPFTSGNHIRRGARLKIKTWDRRFYANAFSQSVYPILYFYLRSATDQFLCANSLQVNYNERIENSQDHSESRLVPEQDTSLILYLASGKLSAEVLGRGKG